MKKRLLSLLLAFVMLISLLPATALAAEVNPDDPDSFVVGNTITLDTNDESLLPELSEDSYLEWEGPEYAYQCGESEHTHTYSGRDRCYELTNCTENHRRHDISCYSTIASCGKEEHSHSDACGVKYVWTLVAKENELDMTKTSTITFRIVNGTWSDDLSLDADAEVSDDGREVVFTVYSYGAAGYVYVCGGAMESMLDAILNGKADGSSYIEADEGYELKDQDWEILQGGLIGGVSNANDQMEDISETIHGHDTNIMGNDNTIGFIAETVYVLTLTKTGYRYAGTIDNGGTAALAGEESTESSVSQTNLTYEATSEAMVFTPADNYEITGVEVSVNKNDPISYEDYVAEYFDRTVSLDNCIDTDGTFTFPAETVIHDIDVTVTTSLETYTVTWVDADGEELEVDEDVPYGSTPSYDGTTPTKESDAAAHYGFVGWDVIDPDDGDADDPQVDDVTQMIVTEDTTFQAVFEPTSVRYYNVIWRDYDRVELETDESVPYGTTINFVSGADEGGKINEEETYATDGVSYGGETPTKPADHENTYEFDYWEVYVGSYDTTNNTVTGNVEFWPVFKAEAIPVVATVEVILNGTFEGSAYESGDHVDISTVETVDKNEIYLSKDGTTFVTLEKTTTGTYKSASDGVVPNGTYHIYVKRGNDYEQIGTNTIVIENADGIAYLPYYSVTYDDGDASGKAQNMPETEYYYIGEDVDVSSQIPTWDGHVFLNWTEENKDIEPSTALETVRLDTSITEPHTLTAVWENTVNVDVVVNVTHNTDTQYFTNDLNIHLTHLVGTEYPEYPGSHVTVSSSTWYGSGEDAKEDGVTTYTLSGEYVDLDKDGTYSAHAALAGYEHVHTSEPEWDETTNTYTVTIDLEYDPDGFELEFEVLVDGDTPAGLVPAEVDVKVTCWNGTSWVPIEEHTKSSIAVEISGTPTDGYYRGSGSQHVLAADPTDSSKLYLYRIEIVSLDAIGTYSTARALTYYSVEMQHDDAVDAVAYKDYESVASGFFPEGAYDGLVTVANDCVNGLTTGGLYGSHASGSGDELEQHDDITAYITVTPYNVELDLNYEVEGGDTTFATIKDRFTIPELNDYGTPTRDGYTFEGWYLRAGDTEIIGGEAICDLDNKLELGGTLTLYAKWSENFAIKGRVVVDLGYPCDDESREVVVVLRWKPEDGTYFVQEDTRTVKLVAEKGKNYAISEEYVFSNVANTGEYHIHVAVPEGGKILYQNEPESLNATNIKDASHVAYLLASTNYDANSYTVVDQDSDGNSDGTAWVNIYMDADDFILGYRVDASAISVNYRPSDIHLALCHDHNDNYFHVIKNLDIIATLDSDGITDIFKIQVPPYHASGYLYDYVISTLTYDVQKLGDDWADVKHKHYLNDPETAKAAAPFAIRYEGPANYQAKANSDGLYQDVTLEAIFEPNIYNIKYEIGSNAKWQDGFTPVTAHKWSWDTDLGNPVPERDGYVFDGWTVTETSSGKAVTLTKVGDDLIVPADLWTDITLTANWEEDVLDDPDDNTTDGDGIPDKYQVLVHYVAGEGGSVSPTVEVITISEDGSVESKDVTAAGSTATADTANQYVFDGWSYDYTNVTFDKTKAVTGQFTITGAKGGETYVFTANFAEDKKGEPGPHSDGTADKYQAFVEFLSYDTATGTVTDEKTENPDDPKTGIHQTYTFKDETTGKMLTSGDVTPSKENILVTPVLAEKEGDVNYAFDVWTKNDGRTVVNPFTTENVPGNTTIKFYAHFAKDELVDPTKDPDPNKPGDGIPDKYQVVVTYQVVNGYWSEGTTDDDPKTAVFTLYTKDEATGEWERVPTTPVLGSTIPEGMIPNESHVAPGEWLEGITADTPVVGYATYTFKFNNAIAPAVAIEKNVNVEKAVVGEPVVYTITVTNSGNIDLKDLTVTETFSGDITKATVTLPEGVTKVADTDNQYKIAELKMGDANAVTITIEYVPTEADKTAGKLTNTVMAQSDDDYDVNNTPDDPDDDEPVVDIDETPDVPVEDRKSGLTVEKTTEQTTVKVGETITWNIKITNSGNTKLVGIDLVDTLTGAGAADAKATLSKSGPIDLAAGDFVELTATYVVESEDAGAKIYNTVVATADDGTEGEGGTKDPVVVENAAVEVTKTANKTKAEVGDRIVYTITVKNTGNQNLTGIKVIDEMIDVEEIIDLAVGETWSKDYSYRVTDEDEGTLRNVVVVKDSNDKELGRDTETTKVEDDDDPYVPPTKPVKPQLNKEDHFAYIIGKDDGLVHPLAQITRAETATIFFRMLLEESRQYYWTQENNYVDVTITDWFNNAASTLNNAGIMTGRPGNQFAPYANITRAEFATLAVRFFLDEDVEITENNLTDVKGHWAEANINLAYALGLITGLPDNTFRPDQEITRAEAMVIVNRVLERHPDKDHLLNNMITWPDNLDTTAWYYADVQEATNSHTYVLATGKDGEKYEIWQQMLEVRDWAALEKAWSEYNSSHNPGEVVDVNVKKDD